MWPRAPPTPISTHVERPTQILLCTFNHTLSTTALKQRRFCMLTPLLQRNFVLTNMSEYDSRMVRLLYIRGPFAKFMDSPYYSESALCGGVVTVSFSKYLPWKAMKFLQRSTHFSRQTVDHFEISCIWAPFSWLEKSRNSMGRDLDFMADVLTEFHRSTFSKPNTEFNSGLTPCDFWTFPTMKMELRGKKFRSDQWSAARFREVGRAL
jgi:hypothetical protein